MLLLFDDGREVVTAIPACLYFIIGYILELEVCCT